MESKIFIQPQPKYDVVVSNTSDIPNLIITKAKEKMVVTILKGVGGSPGYTPIKGIDYWTNVEVEEIKAQLIEYINTVILGGES